MARYRCVRRSQIRAEAALDSAKAGVLEADTVVEALSTLRLPEGTLRIRFRGGWVSASTGKGLIVMQKLEEAEEVAEEQLHQGPEEEEGGATVAHTTEVARLATSVLNLPEHAIAQHLHGEHTVARMVETVQAGRARFASLPEAPQEHAAIEHLLGDSIQQLHQLFCDLDLDHDGTVDVHDVGPITAGATQGAQELLSAADENSDGVLNFFEFASLFLQSTTDGKYGHTSDGPSPKASAPPSPLR